MIIWFDKYMKNRYLTTTFAVAALLFVALSLQSCFDERQVVLRGRLYTDSTLAVPVPNDTIKFRWTDGVYIGCCLTDDDGNFGFSFWSDGADKWDADQSKFSPNYGHFIAVCKNDTLAWFEANGYAKYENLELYFGNNSDDMYWK